MTPLNRIDRECRKSLVQFLAALPGGLNAISDINARRAATRALLEAANNSSQTSVKIDKHLIPSADGRAEIELRSYRLANETKVLPGLVFIHGGGMCTGDLDGEEFKCLALCEALNIAVVSLDYRKAPEHPYPAAPEDCYSGLQWIIENANTLKIDVNNLGIYGGSAGGGLSIAIALMARDRGGPAIKYVMSIYPMLDDRNDTVSSQQVLDVGVWDRATNIEAWQWYLNGKAADQYAAPSRALSLEGLPQTFIDVGDVDLFRDEAVEFASRLTRASVVTELHVYAGAYHGSEVLAPDASLSKTIIATRLSALRRFIDQ